MLPAGHGLGFRRHESRRNPSSPWAPLLQWASEFAAVPAGSPCCQPAIAGFSGEMFPHARGPCVHGLSSFAVPACAPSSTGEVGKHKSSLPPWGGAPGAPRSKSQHSGSEGSACSWRGNPKSLIIGRDGFRPGGTKAKMSIRTGELIDGVRITQKQNEYSYGRSHWRCSHFVKHKVRSTVCIQIAVPAQGLSKETRCAENTDALTKS